MIIKFVLPLVAIAGLAYGVVAVLDARKVTPPSVPTVQPPKRPAMRSIAGSGLIEARMENIPVGSPAPGVVWEVFVKIGQKVAKDDPLFRLDDRELKADLAAREASLAAERAQLHRLQVAPRPEDIPPAQAAVEEAVARLADADAALNRSDRLYQRQMVPAGDYDKDRFTAAAARAALAKANSDLAKILAGSWKEDIEVAKAAMQMAQSQVDGVKVNIDRLTVRAQADGEVLQVNIRPGQFAASIWKDPLIVLGDVKRLHVRVDVDENDLPLFRPGTDAIATLKGRPQVQFPLEYVKVEPYVIPKRSLTGDNAERVDTRVLQVIYALPDKRPVDVFVGQQMDVYLRAGTLPVGVAMDADPEAAKPFEDD